MTPVRCCMGGCRSLGQFFEPDGQFWFCDPCYTVHLTIRRQEYVRSRPPRPAGGRAPSRPCGTHAAYTRHKDRGEDPCEDCVLAEREYQRARYARRKAS